MKRLAWLSDIHLNFLSYDERREFYDSVVETRADAALVGGDLAEAWSLSNILAEMAARLPIPVYFVLGNHDFYGRSIAAVRADAAAAVAKAPSLVYLTQAGVVALGERTALVGHDGWADGRLGDYAGSKVLLNDYTRITDFIGLDAAARLAKLQELADEAVAHFRRILPEAFDSYRHVILLTHVPPFREACWHEGHISGPEFLPHFASGAAGEALLEIMRPRRRRKLTVLCGHSHGRGTCRPLPNLEVFTAGAEYGQPEIEQIFSVK
jgi:predicted MPP superfamily phosphohydrolase